MSKKVSKRVDQLSRSSFLRRNSAPSMASILVSPTHVRLFPRRKKYDAVGASTGYRRNERLPQLLDSAAISKFFCLVQGEAAKRLGISVTTLKQVCRKLGIERWPGPQRRRRAPFDDGAVCSETPAANTSLNSRGPSLGDIRTHDEKFVIQNGSVSEIASHDSNFLDIDCGFADGSHTVPARTLTRRTLRTSPACTPVAGTSEIRAFDAQPQVHECILIHMCQEVEDERGTRAGFCSVDCVPLLRDCSGPFRFTCVNNHLFLFRMHHKSLLRESYISSCACPACKAEGRLQGAFVRTRLPVIIFLCSLD
jgi:hypothetical protein